MKRDFSMSAAMAINATAMFTVAAGFVLAALLIAVRCTVATRRVERLHTN